MKIITVIITLCAAVVIAAPSPEGVDVVARADADCAKCTEKYEFCIKHGHSTGQTGCLQTCREHVCHIDPGCKSCGGEFDLCPEVSRYHSH